MGFSKILNNNKAFTLVEILLVVVIIVALSSMVMPRLVGRSEQAKISVAKSDIEANLATALKLYELDNGKFPTTNQGLKALRVKPTVSPLPDNWNGPYVDKDLLDPWGNAYIYSSPGRNNPDYDLYSEGPDTTTEEDNITNWQ